MTHSRIHILKTEADYQAAMAEYETYFDAPPAVNSEAADRFQLLGLLIEKYEDDRFPMPIGSAIDAIRFAMERLGRTQADLATLLGSRSRASEILNGRRELTLAQIRLLVQSWNIPAAALVGQMEMA